MHRFGSKFHNISFLLFFNIQKWINAVLIWLSLLFIFLEPFAFHSIYSYFSTSTALNNFHGLNIENYFRHLDA